MANTDKPSDGLNVLSDFLVGNRISGSNTTDTNEDKGDRGNIFQDIDPDELKKIMEGDESEEEIEEDGIETSGKDDKKEQGTEESDIKSDKSEDNSGTIEKEDTQKSDEKDTGNEQEDSEYESEISSFFANRLMENLGVDLGNEEFKVDKIEDVVELMSEIVNENSKPTYASEEVEAYDEFVRGGGSLRDFYNEVYSGKINTETIDIENAEDQRAVIRENLLNQGYKEERVRKMLARYEENETLKDEAEDALDLVKEFNNKKALKLLEDQKKEAQASQKAQQKFYSDVNSTISTMQDVRGIPLTDKDKRELLRYAFTPDENGLSKFQQESSDVRNILELAFLLMNKDKKIDNATQKQETNAYKTLLEKLKARGNRGEIETKNPKNAKTDGKVGNLSLGDFGKGIIFK